MSSGEGAVPFDRGSVDQGDWILNDEQERVDLSRADNALLRCLLSVKVWVLDTGHIIGTRSGRLHLWTATGWAPLSERDLVLEGMVTAKQCEWMLEPLNRLDRFLKETADE